MSSQAEKTTPVKLWYRIGEVARIAEVDTSVLRHWEQEFRGLRPRRTKSGQRVYSRADVEKILEIKRLLYEQRYTTEGAIRFLRQKGSEPRDQSDPLLAQNQLLRDALQDIRQDVLDLIAFLEQESSS